MTAPAGDEHDGGDVLARVVVRRASRRIRERCVRCCHRAPAGSPIRASRQTAVGSRSMRRITAVRPW